MRLAVAFALVLVAACGTDQAPAGVATYEAGDDGNTALLEGVLVHQNGCFYVKAREGGQYLPVFPHDSVGSSGSTLTYGGDDYESGATLSLGGGEAPSTADWMAELEIPDSCVDSRLWVVSPGG